MCRSTSTPSMRIPDCLHGWRIERVQRSEVEQCSYTSSSEGQVSWVVHGGWSVVRDGREV